MKIEENQYNELKKLTCRNFNSEVAISQIKQTNFWGYCSWGVSKIFNFEDAGVLLKVNGHHHKGWVFITLDFMDLYNVHLLNNKFEVKESIEEIYCFDLFDTIDEKIERIPEYNR